MLTYSSLNLNHWYSLLTIEWVLTYWLLHFLPPTTRPSLTSGSSRSTMASSGRHRPPSEPRRGWILSWQVQRLFPSNDCWQSSTTSWTSGSTRPQASTASWAAWSTSTYSPPWGWTWWTSPSTAAQLVWTSFVLSPGLSSLMSTSTFTTTAKWAWWDIT